MPGTASLNDSDWLVRHYIYSFFVENVRPPTPKETAVHFEITEPDAVAVYQRLNDYHHIFLQAGTNEILMANPLSAVPTRYQVTVNSRTLWANCAWDSLGIPAMLHADAVITARDVLTGQVIDYSVSDGHLSDSDYVVHFPLMVSRWYEDLVYT